MSLAKRSKMKTEHAGAKNGGGYWGTRSEAKKISRRHRRESDKREVSANEWDESQSVAVNPEKRKKQHRKMGLRATKAK